ncbi:MAG: hypothetical protein ACHQ52_10805, partial [Candidatus Eisenbacteria bacterium]
SRRMTPGAIYWVPDLAGLRLGVMACPRGDGLLAEDVRAWRLAGLNQVVSLLESREAYLLGLEKEREMCEAMGLTFHSFPIPDHGVPDSPRETEIVVRRIATDIIRGDGVAIHCRAAIGRSPLIAACVLVHVGVPASAAFDWVGRGRGLEVPDTASQLEWFSVYVREILHGSEASSSG